MTPEQERKYYRLLSGLGSLSHIAYGCHRQAAKPLAYTNSLSSCGSVKQAGLWCVKEECCSVS